MAPVKPARRLARKSATAGPSKSQRKSNAKLPPKMSKQIKTKPGAHAQKPTKKKQPQYTDKQLSLPVLNSIIPANAKTTHRAGGTGKKKNKVYVDDTDSMMTILAIVNADKEGQIESKVAKERQMEEIREARRKEAEKKEARRKDKLEEVKEEIKEDGKRRKQKSHSTASDDVKKTTHAERAGQPKRKSVSFA
ncbi:60S ribosomal subunit assembly/export protein [Neophaeococcomyces mojaviensis]|uniref:60S ribosomal subunit assembly/export protein n=1 Tax=Neophaeococcomyces mojaviensis TaxID=3383035 RepID=A0ACC3AJ01_9EURO|nr:60S ribosomal subunit assembly/export protein [Knufia sp. JES_112]